MGMDMDKLLQQVGQMQEQMQKAQQEMENEVVEGTAGGGAVTVKATGRSCTSPGRLALSS